MLNKLIKYYEGKVRELEFIKATQAELLKEYLCTKSVTYQVNFEDLEYLRNKTICILGAAGTIGSQMARILQQYGISKMVLVDMNEQGLYELKNQLNPTNVVYRLANICDTSYLGEIFIRYHPQIIFHFAQYKSVIMGEADNEGYFHNNCRGINSLLSVLKKSPEVERLIFASTDKVGNQALNYAKTKEKSEILLEEFTNQQKKISTVAIRYCNVCDTNASFALKDFIQQILNNLPITLRSPDKGITMPERYFITKDTACNLAIKAGAEATDKLRIFSLNKKLISPISMADAAKMLLEKYLGDKNKAEEWFKKNVIYVSPLSGERMLEILGDDQSGKALADAPLVEI